MKGFVERIQAKLFESQAGAADAPGGGALSQMSHAHLPVGDGMIGGDECVHRADHLASEDWMERSEADFQYLYLKIRQSCQCVYHSPEHALKDRWARGAEAQE